MDPDEVAHYELSHLDLQSAQVSALVCRAEWVEVKQACNLPFNLNFSWALSRFCVEWKLDLRF